MPLDGDPRPAGPPAPDTGGWHVGAARGALNRKSRVVGRCGAGRDVVGTVDRPRCCLAAPVRENCTVSGDQPRFRYEITKAYEELATPVEGEPRREPIVDADVPCPRCGGRAWLLIERRAEPEQPFTRWRTLACANCGAAEGWESAGRARRGRAAARWNEWDEETFSGMPEEPTIDHVDRLAPFRVLAPRASAELRSYSHVEGKITAVTVAAGGVEVTTEIRHQIVYSLPVERHPQDRARERLQTSSTTGRRFSGSPDRSARGSATSPTPVAEPSRRGKGSRSDDRRRRRPGLVHARRARRTLRSRGRHRR
jgi:hypothetical protein